MAQLMTIPEIDITVILYYEDRKYPVLSIKNKDSYRWFDLNLKNCSLTEINLRRYHDKRSNSKFKNGTV